MDDNELKQMIGLRVIPQGREKARVDILESMGPAWHDYPRGYVDKYIDEWLLENPNEADQVKPDHKCLTCKNALITRYTVNDPETRCLLDRSDQNQKHLISECNRYESVELTGRTFDDGYLSGLQASVTILKVDGLWEAAGVMRRIVRNYKKTKTTSGVDAKDLE